ncbi:hypothetical protein [Novosphingobium sp. PY1]|uniref:hypothetical protein n=1 Tax=Novosphingobium sp. PY1 TaxID=1882221 RepID=UPI001A8EC6A0|nr:hypothetical protein [Novosphingobium sp. PY1]GFM28632.1 autoinducer synthesis protein [Novosphingobium sp. PY1]
MPSRVRAPRALESKAFRAMFAARKEVFVDLLKWDLPVFAEHALETGITGYTGVADLAWFQQVMRFGWHCSPLGRIALCEGRKLIALHIRIDERTLDGLRTAGIYQPRTLKLVAGEEAANER